MILLLLVCAFPIYQGHRQQFKGGTTESAGYHCGRDFSAWTLHAGKTVSQLMFVNAFCLAEPANNKFLY